MTVPQEHIPLFQTPILAWHAEHGRDCLPWRLTRDPYVILVSEIMLQQTQVNRVIPLHSAFIARFPTLDSLAAAELGEVLVLWKGLGYNRRAKHLWELAKAAPVGSDGKKFLPNDAAALLALPGVGHYTAAAVRAFAWNADIAAIDTNVKRVHTRYFGAEQYTDGLPAQTLPAGRAREWNGALMDFGSAICSKVPKCSECPLQQRCVAFARQEFTVAVPKQSRFVGSNRWYRGKILDALRTGPKTRAELDAAGSDNSEAIGKALTQLLAESMVRQEGTTFQI